MNKVILIIGLLAIIFPQGINWQDNGLPIRQGVHIEWQRTVCPGDNGTAIFVWSDTRYAARNVFAQKVDQNGNFLWGAEGTAVTHLPGRQEDPIAITDGNGGAFIAWVDYRFDEEGDIYIQHVDENGYILMDEGGAALARVDGRHLTINMCTDSAGGVFVTWQDNRNLLHDDIYGTHVSADHDIVSPGSGVAVIEMNGTQGAKSLEYAGSGQATLIWADSRSGAGIDIYSQKINMDMTKVFAEDGLPVAVTSALENFPRTTYMSNDTSFVIWQSETTSSEIYFNFLTSDGLVFSDPQVLSTFNSEKETPRVKRNAVGDVIVQWIDFRSGAVKGNHYYQKITKGGVRVWDQDGVNLDSFGDDHHSRFVVDATGGTHIFWERGIYRHADIMYQKILNDGSLANAEPLVVSNADGHQSMPVSVYDGVDGAYVIFASEEFGSIDLQTQLIQSGATQFPDNGLVAMLGLDGDVAYVSSFYTGGIMEEVLINWVDSRNNKKLFGGKITESGPHPSYINGTQLAGYEIAIVPLYNEPTSAFQNDHLLTANFYNPTGHRLIRLNRYDTNFNPLWGDSGIVVYEGTEQVRVQILPLPMGNNVCVFWSEFRNLHVYEIFMQVFNQNGEELLTNGGVCIVNSLDDDNYVEAVMVMENGNILIIWVVDGGGLLKYNFLTESGDIATTGTSDGFVLADTGSPENLKLLEQSNGSAALVVWEELHNFSKDIYLNEINQDGTLSLSPSIAVTSADNDQSNIALARGDSRALIVWEDFENGTDFNLTGRFLNLNSLELIGENIPICQEASDQGAPALAYDGGDRFIVAWENGQSVQEDSTNFEGLDIYIQVVDENGLLLQEEGMVIASEYRDQSAPQFVNLHWNNPSDPVWLLHWIDMRSSGKANVYNLYAQSLDIVFNNVDDELIPGTFTVSAAYPNPFNDLVALDVTIAELEPVKFTITNVLGRQIYQQTLLPDRPGSFQIHWNGKDILQRALPSGIYLYSIKSNDDIINGKFIYLK